MIFQVSIFPEKNQEGTTPVDVPQDGWKSRLFDVVSSTSWGRWSPILWKGGKRRKNYLFGHCDFLVLDVDSGWAARDAAVSLEGYDFLIVATKSHGLAKNGGDGSDHFRIIIPLEKRVKTLAAYYATMRLAARLFPAADQKCLDAARFYWTSQREVLHSGEGGRWRVPKPGRQDIERAKMEIHGTTLRLPGTFNGRGFDPLREIKVGGFGNSKFDLYHQASGAMAPAVKKAIREPIRVTGETCKSNYLWLPFRTAVYRRELEVKNGQSRYLQSEFVGEAIRAKGLLAIELREGTSASRWRWLGATITAHPGTAGQNGGVKQPTPGPGGKRAWIKYDLGDIPWWERGQALASLCRGVRAAAAARGLGAHARWEESLERARRLPAIPTEIRRLMERPPSKWLTPATFVKFPTPRLGVSAASPLAPPVAPPVGGAAIVEGAAILDGEPRALGDGVGQGADAAGLAGEFGQAPTDPTSPNFRLGEIPIPREITRLAGKHGHLASNLMRHPGLILGLRVRRGAVKVTTGYLRISSTVLSGWEKSESSEGGGGGERAARRFLGRMVRRGYLREVASGQYVPGRKARTYEATDELITLIVEALGRKSAGAGPGPLAGGRGVEVVRLSGDPDGLPPPSDGAYNDWIWKAAWRHHDRRSFERWLEDNHGEFISAKPGRRRQALNAWKRRARDLGRDIDG